MRLISLIRTSRILSSLLLAVVLLAGPAYSGLACGAWMTMIGQIASADDARVRDAVRLSAQGDADLALIRLDNGKQGSVQVWTAWALLQLGSRLGALAGGSCNRGSHQA